MRAIDLNADTGEADTPEWRAVEAAVMTQITSANIACGGHAGDLESMKRTVALAAENSVNIGAHPAYPDKANFGRKSHKLGEDISASNLRNEITSQIVRLAEVAAAQGQSVSYVKSHGALYNDAVFNPELAALIAETIASIDSNLWLMGAPNSCLTTAAENADLKFIAEGFVDRRYVDAGHLQSRKEDGSVFKEHAICEAQAQALWSGKPVTTASGQDLNLQVDTLCLHSDTPGADVTARSIRASLEKAGATIQAFTNG